MTPVGKVIALICKEIEDRRLCPECNRIMRPVPGPLSDKLYQWRCDYCEILWVAVDMKKNK